MQAAVLYRKHPSTATARRFLWELMATGDVVVRPTVGDDILQEIAEDVAARWSVTISPLLKVLFLERRWRQRTEGGWCDRSTTT